MPYQPRKEEYKLPKSPNHRVHHSCYGGRGYHQLSYMEKRFGGCLYTKQNFDTDPLGSRTGDVGRLSKVPNVACQTHDGWNSKESDWWCDAMRREEKCKKVNLRNLKRLCAEGKVKYSAARQPRTVMGQIPATISEGSLRKLQLSQSDYLMQKALELENGGPATKRSCSSMSMHDYESQLLGRHGLELTADRQRLRATKEAPMPRVRVEQIEALHMATLMHGPKSQRLTSHMANFMDRQAGRKSNHCSGMEIGADYNQVNPSSQKPKVEL